MKTTPKVLIIGFDGLEPELVERWLDRLPNFAYLKKEGVFGRIHSTVPPITAPAWASFATGLNPAKHGVVDFEICQKGEYRRELVDARDIKGEKLWEVLSQHGKKVGVLNVPLTYPPTKVNGFMVSGRFTPSGREFTYPVSLKDELRQLIGDYPIDWIDRIEFKDPESTAREVTNITLKLKKAAEYFLFTKPWDFFVVQFDAPDTIQHLFWRFMDEKHPDYSPEKARKYGKEIFSCYKLMDKIIGDLIKIISQETIVLVLSDHGMGPVYRDFHPNRWLAQLGLLRLKKDVPLGLKLIYGGLSRLGLTEEKIWDFLTKTNTLKMVRSLLKGKDVWSIGFSLDNVDWEKTWAYAYGHLGQIFLNLVGREKQGKIRNKKEYEEIRTKIIRELRLLLDKETGLKPIDKVFRKEEIYSGPFLDRVADILFTLKDGYTVCNDFNLKSKVLFAPIGQIQSSKHRLKGVFAAWGRGIRRGKRIEQVHLVDIFPTVLYIFDIPISSNIDGRVLRELFN